MPASNMQYIKRKNVYYVYLIYKHLKFKILHFLSSFMFYSSFFINI